MGQGRSNGKRAIMLVKLHLRRFIILMMTRNVEILSNNTTKMPRVAIITESKVKPNYRPHTTIFWTSRSFIKLNLQTMTLLRHGLSQTGSPQIGLTRANRPQLGQSIWNKALLQIWEQCPRLKLQFQPYITGGLVFNWNSRFCTDEDSLFCMCLRTHSMHALITLRSSA